MNVYVGVITKVLNDTNFTIEFTIKGYLEACKAYPIDVLDKPQVKDSIIIYEIDSELFGFSYLYQKLRIKDFTRISIGSTQVLINKEDITISSGKSSITIDQDNNISIDSNTDIRIDANTRLDVTAPVVNITSPTVTVKGNMNVIGVLTVNGNPVLV